MIHLNKIILSILIIVFYVHVSYGCLDRNDIVNTFSAIDKKPDNEDGKINVDVGVEINRFNYLEKENSLSIDGFIVRNWEHPSMKYSTLNFCQSPISITHLKHKIWVPQISFINAVDVILYSHSTSIHLNENGTIIHRERFRQTVPCHINITTYPFGNVTCELNWSNSDAVLENVQYNWIETNIRKIMSTGVQLTTTTESWTTTTTKASIHLFAKFKVLRPEQLIILLFYFPSILFMLLSWMSLLLGPMAITRTIMNVGTMIALTILYFIIPSNLAETSKITLVDAWKIFSLIFVFVIIMELIVVCLMASFGRSRLFAPKKKKRNYEVEPLYEEMNDLRTRKTRKTCALCRISALILDLFTFILSGIVLAIAILSFAYKPHVIVEYLNNLTFGKLLDALITF